MTPSFTPTRGHRSIPKALATLALLGALGTAQAAIFKDAQLESLQGAGRYAELEQLAQSRLKANAADAEASAALSLALTLADAGDAKRLEAAVRGSQPEIARLIRAYIAGEAKKWGEMETELLALKPGKDAAMLDEVREATMQLALPLLKDGKDLAKAKSLYESLQREQPSQAGGFYGMGRVHAAQGQTDEAIRAMERARTLSGAEDYPIDHRLGDAYLAKGDKAQAKAAYERFIANKRAKPANVEDARRSLAKLG